MNDWMQRCYARLLIDNHITEDDPAFMSRFDPLRYVTLVKQAGVEAAMVYACCHNGNCTYPTRVGHMHRNLHGRDIFGETVQRLRQEGIYPIAYYTSIYHNHSAKNNPDWRIQDISGSQHGGRFWWSCPNNKQYAEFTRSQIAEIIAYDVDGIFIDMTFWPVICCCNSCRQKFRGQTGLEIPEIIDWTNPHWVAFQRFREQSMVDFCQDLERSIKAQKDITVTFQNSLIIGGWKPGQMPGIAGACDYTSGDFYGGKYQHILGAKILSAATRRQPYEYMTSRCVNLNDHTSMKSEAELRCEAATTLANGGAYFFIDAINPDGTLMDTVYQRMGNVSASLAPFVAKVKEHAAVLSADTGLYFSMASLIDPALNGTALRELSASANPAYDELLGTSILLTRAHRPFRVMAAGHRQAEAHNDLSQLKTLIINNAQVMSADEVEKVRTFVRGGGTLIATGLTSLWNLNGAALSPTTAGAPDFALADVFGVSYAGKMSRRVNYLSLTDGSEFVLGNQPAPLVRLCGAEMVAGLAEPLFDPDDPQHYASIHSNPPGPLSGYAGLTVNRYGQGRCIYLAPSLLAIQQDAQQTFGTWLLQTYTPKSEITATNAPPAVEITILRCSTADTYLVAVVNYQKELPNIPVHGLQVEIRLPSGDPKSCIRISDGQAISFRYTKGVLAFEIPTLETIEMIEVS